LVFALHSVRGLVISSAQVSDHSVKTVIVIAYPPGVHIFYSYLFALCSVKNNVLHFVGQLRKRHVKAEFILLCKSLEKFGAHASARSYGIESRSGYGSLRYAEGRVRNYKLRRKFAHHTQSGTL